MSLSHDGRENLNEDVLHRLLVELRKRLQVAVKEVFGPEKRFHVPMPWVFGHPSPSSHRIIERGWQGVGWGGGGGGGGGEGEGGVKGWGFQAVRCMTSLRAARTLTQYC